MSSAIFTIQSSIVGTSNVFPSLCICVLLQLLRAKQLLKVLKHRYTWASCGKPLIAHAAYNLEWLKLSEQLLIEHIAIVSKTWATIIRATLSKYWYHCGTRWTCTKGLPGHRYNLLLKQEHQPPNGTPVLKLKPSPQVEWGQIVLLPPQLCQRWAMQPWCYAPAWNQHERDPDNWCPLRSLKLGV